MGLIAIGAVGADAARDAEAAADADVDAQADAFGVCGECCGCRAI